MPWGVLVCDRLAVACPLPFLPGLLLQVLRAPQPGTLHLLYVVRMNYKNKEARPLGRLYALALSVFAQLLAQQLILLSLALEKAFQEGNFLVVELDNLLNGIEHVLHGVVVKIIDIVED